VDAPRELSPPLRWDRVFAQNALRNGRMEEIRKDSPGPSGIMSRLPISVTLRTGYADTQPTAALLLEELVTGKVSRRIPLILKEPASRDFRYSTLFTSNGGHLAFAGRSILALLGDRLFIQTVSDDVAGAFPVPFHFKPQDKLIFLDPAGANTILHATEGGERPLEFDLSITRRAVRIDHKTGVLTLDGPVLMEDAVKFLADKLKTSVEARRRDGGTTRRIVADSGARLAFLVEATRAPFTWVTGREPKGVPVLLPVGIVAADAKGQTTRLDYQVLMEVPQEQVLELLRKPEEKEEEPEKPAASLVIPAPPGGAQPEDTPCPTRSAPSAAT